LNLSAAPPSMLPVLNMLSACRGTGAHTRQCSNSTSLTRC
jgi:hypothetical protein